jgi:undecaprenyl-diphosphatase
VSITKPAGEPSVWQELRTVGRRYLPWWFAVGVVVVLVGLLITKVLESTAFADADAGLDKWLEKQRTPTGLTVTHIGTLFGETPTIVGLTTVTVIVFRLVFHRWRESVLLAIVVTGQSLIFLAATTYWLGTALILAWHTRHVWLRWLLVVVGVVIPIGVAASRMYRGMHYPTDTATSFLLGLALLFIAFHALPLGEHGDQEGRTDRSSPGPRARTRTDPAGSTADLADRSALARPTRTE